jgi:hypothetical protein
MLPAVDIAEAVPIVLPKVPCNCVQVVVVLDDGVHGVHGVGAENGEIYKIKAASELLFAFECLEKNQRLF